MTALLASFPPVLALQLWLRWPLWPLAVTAAATFPVFYFARSGGVTHPRRPAGRALVGLGFGAALPLMLGYCVEARVLPRSALRALGIDRP